VRLEKLGIDRNVSMSICVYLLVNFTELKNHFLKRDNYCCFINLEVTKNNHFHSV